MLSYYRTSGIAFVMALGAIVFSMPGEVLGEDSAQQKQVLVANVDPSLLPDSVKVADIVRGGKRSWSDGTILTVVLPGRKHPFFKQTEKDFFVGKGPSLQRHWVRLVFSGRGNPPLYAENPEEMCEMVRVTRGSFALFYGPVPDPCQSLARSPLPVAP